MLLNEPGRTSYDLEFSLLGFPVRVHPAFVILPIVLGGGGLDSGMNPGVTILAFILVFFVSILVHEMGHALAYRTFGQPARIVLYWMGGLAISDGGWMGGRGRGRGLSSNEQIIVSLAGPAAGLILAALLVGIVFALGGTVSLHASGIPTLSPDLRGTSIESSTAVILLLSVGLFCNFVWSLLNLLPVFPLDGGQVAREVFLRADPFNGIRYSLILAVVVSAVIALYGFATQSTFMGIFFALMGYSNFQMLQQMNFRGGGGRPW